MIEIRHLKKSYETETPLKDVNVTIHKGDVISVIGPSGTGKSTLLRCINGLEEATDGHILIDGEDITDPKCDINKVRLKLGMVFQSFNLYEHLTVVENCMLAQTVLLKKSRREAYEKAMDMLKVVRMDGWALQYPESLSGGQKQRVAISRALCQDPEIILFDEPTSALDPLTVAEVEDVIADLAKKGITMMCVTHSMDFARKISNRIFYMDQGGVYEEGTPEEIFDRPKRELTKRFVKRLSSLEFEIVDNAHNIEEEIGKIVKFGSEHKLSSDRIMNLVRCYEESVSMIENVIKTVGNYSVAIEYSENDERLTITFTDRENRKISLDDEAVRDSIEYKLLSHYVREYKTEETDTGCSYTLVI